MTSQEARDFHMAYEMHENLNCLGVTENSVSLNERNSRYLSLPFSLVDQELELIDPTPNIHTLFIQFNARFFRDKLASVEVKWSNRMKCAAGICTFHSRNKECVISLSAPLLKLRPRKDLIETLLHEMIHAYLFLTNNDQDRDGHGPNFCRLMHKINKEAGTNITIYHDFHDEVKLYRQHWWKCNGPCQRRPPYFGTVRRSMNRAPGPMDFWWKEHQEKCNGQFIKIKEPENFKSRSKQNISKPISKDNKSNNRLTDWLAKRISNQVIPTSSKASSNNNSKIFTQADNAKPSTSKDNGGTNSSRAVNEKDTQDLSVGIKKLGSSSNNVHGWGISGPGENVKSYNVKNISKNPKFSCSGVLGGSSNGQSNLLTKFKPSNEDENRRGESIDGGSSAASSSAAEGGYANDSVLNLSQPRNNSYLCPICNVPMTLENRYSHIDSCLINNTSLIDEMNNNINNNNNNEELMLMPIQTFATSATEQNIDATPNKRVRLDNSNDTNEYVTCPVCGRRLPITDINQHLDECLLEADTARKAAIPSTSRASYDDSIISINSSCSSDLDDSVLTDDPQPSTSTSTCKNDTVDLERKCLVCNVQIALDVSLNEHLEECIGSVFNDDIIIDDKEDDNNDTLVVENNSTENKYPCPVCMQIISENLMNQHLDMCLKNE
ncbi:sprT-like domain-containing protein Spartan [Monomorium pharaonis]|uniref:sprT-like domain-containing protein Spartan n=1 Tax=Monomorium pharaonis TaxID=307658 RepID=UPI00063EFD42|nr:sprT-like domain-containing protein Spartan [Monomorium pharaonis]XP_036141621.1 sprT-like domain-containing protein Spartan [Monomorium pharaonis]